MTEPALFTTQQLDAPTDELLELLCAAVIDCGAFYSDPERPWDAGGLVYLSRDKDGVTHARRILKPLTLGEIVLSRGLVRLVQEYRGQAQTTPRHFWSPYQKMIDRLPLTHPEFLTLPETRGVYSLPAVAVDQGKLVPAWSGLHRDSRLLFVGKQVPGSMIDNVDPGYPHLNTWMQDIHFTHEEYRGNLMGFILACLARPCCPLFPFLVIDATDRKQGKTTVARALAYFLTGKPAAPITHTGDESELEKRIGSFCGLPGPNLVYLDNVRPKRGQSGVIRSQFFATAATSDSPSIRPVYGRTALPVDFPIIVMTMNEAQVENDLYDRAVRVVLDGESGRYFKPSPEIYVRDHLPELHAEALHVLSQVDLSRDFTPCTRFGEWEHIASSVAQVLNLRFNYDPDAVDTPDAVVRELVAVVRELEDERQRPATFQAVAERVRVYRDNLPELASLLRRANATGDKAQGRVIEKFVTKVWGRSLADQGKPIRIKGKGPELIVEEL